ncbi:MAG: precorrin-8X methylmutase [Candidatus Competibacteraceae bacterium]
MPCARFEYLRDPDEIERQSFAQIRRRLTCPYRRRPQQVAMRLAHTSGDPGIVHDLRFSPGAVTAGLAALEKGADVLCDIEMVSHGISKRYLKGQVHCFPEFAHGAERARRSSRFRSMAHDGGMAGATGGKHRRYR